MIPNEDHMRQLEQMARAMRQRKNCTIYIVRRSGELGVATRLRPGDTLLGIMPTLGKLRHEQADALKEQGGSA